MAETSDTWRALLEKWKLTELSLTAGFLEVKFEPSDADRQAAWELYVELLTRITTQRLPAGQGDDATALKSLHSLFSTVREILRRNGSDCKEMTKLAVVVLNQIVRPVTTKWHGLETAAKREDKHLFDAPEQCEAFREDLAVVQNQLRKVQRALADIARVEDLTELEGPGDGPPRSGQ